MPKNGHDEVAAALERCVAYRLSVLANRGSLKTAIGAAISALR